MALFWKKAEEKKAVQNMGLSVKVEYVTALQEVRLLDNFSAKIIQRIKDSFSFSFKKGTLQNGCEKVHGASLPFSTFLLGCIHNYNTGISLFRLLYYRCL